MALIALAPSAAAPRAPGKAAGAITALAFSPNGSLLAAGAYREVLLLEPLNGSLLARLAGHSGRVNALAFCPDGAILAAAGGAPGSGGEIRLWNPRTRKTLRTIKAHDDAIYSVAISPDGKTLAACSYDHLVSLHALDADPQAGSPPPRMLKDHTDAVFALSFSPDGSRLATASGDRTVKVWEVASGKRLYTLSESTAELYAVAFRPDGRQIAAGGVDRMLRVWDVTPTSGRLEQSAFAHDAPVLRLLYSPDSGELVSAAEDRTVRIWDAELLTERVGLEAQKDWPTALALDPKRGRIAVGRFDGTVAFYDANTGQRHLQPGERRGSAKARK